MRSTLILAQTSALPLDLPVAPIVALTCDSTIDSNFKPKFRLQFNVNLPVLSTKLMRTHKTQNMKF